jgi:hypothetical protein
MALNFSIPIYSDKYSPAMNNYIHNVCDQRFNAEYLLPHYQNIQFGTLAIHEKLPARKLEYLIYLLKDHINLGEHINSRADYEKYKRNSNSINTIIDELGPLLYDINPLNAITSTNRLSELPPLPKFENLYKKRSMESHSDEYLSSKKSRKAGRKKKHRKFTKKRRH